MKDNRISIRFTSRQLMLLTELSGLTDKSVSVLIRALVESGLESIMDDEGNFNVPDRKDDEGGQDYISQ